MSEPLTLEGIRLPLASFTLQVDLTLAAPVTGISGPSGAGKTTLLEIIAGLRRPTAGRVVLGERVLTDVSARVHVRPERRCIGYVPQDLALFPHLSTRSNLYYGRKEKADERTDAEVKRIIDLLEIRPLLDRAIHQLSGGEKQRVALGRALLAGPRLLLLDEPLSNLDDKLKEKIIPYLQGIRHELKIPMIYVTHSAYELQMLCDHVLRLREGATEVE